MRKDRSKWRHRGEGSLYRRAGSVNWMLKYTNLDGAVISQSSGTADKTKALAMLRSKLASVTKGELINPKADKITVGELYDAYFQKCEREHYRDIRHLRTRWEKHLKLVFSSMPVTRVRKKTFEDYATMRQHEGAADASINRELSIVRAAFYHQEEDLPKLPKFYQIKEDNTREGYLEDAQYNELAEQCSKVGLWMRSMFELAYLYGWRSGGLKQMRVSQVDLLNLTLTLTAEQSKNGKKVTVDVIRGSTLYTLLASCVSGKEPDAYLFSRDVAGVKPILSFRDAWKSACKQAGVPNLLFHDLRRTAVRNMENAAVPRTTAMSYTGHKTESVYRRYAIVNRANMRDGAQRIEQRKQDALESLQQREASATPTATVALEVGDGSSQVQ